jgi:hypothetical protein
MTSVVPDGTHTHSEEAGTATPNAENTRRDRREEA